MLVISWLSLIFILIQSQNSNLRMVNAIVHIQSEVFYLSETFLEMPSQAQLKKGYNNAVGALNPVELRIEMNYHISPIRYTFMSFFNNINSYLN